METIKKIEATTAGEYNAQGGDIHSVENQRIIGKLVEREVYCCCSCVVGELAKLKPDDEDVIELFSIYPDNSERLEEIEEETSLLENSQGTDDNEVQLGKLNEEKDGLESEQEEPREAYEHWRVESCLAASLKDRGEIIGDLGDGPIWGRCTSGQAILLDYVMADIACSMEILAGQRYSWAE